MWRGDLPKLEWREMFRSDGEEGRSSKKLEWREMFRSDGVEGSSSKAGVEGNVQK